MGITGFRKLGPSPGYWSAVCLLVFATLSVRAQSAPAAPDLLTSQTGTGVVHGSVVDADGDELPGAAVILQPAGDVPALSVVTDGDGNFTISGVPSGPFQVTASAAELQAVAVHGEMKPADDIELDPIALKTATAVFTVSAMSPHDAAEVEVKLEEQQRLLGLLPNFGISYNWTAPPLDTRQKFELATRGVIDPINLAINAGVSLGETWSGQFKEFGTGAAGFWHLYGVSLADVTVGTELGGAILPSLFHQDPRYFWKGSGSVWSRTKYALTRAVICRGDNGRDQFSWSGVLGDFGAGGLANLYYPAQDRRGATLTIEDGAVQLGTDALNNLIQEFVFKHLTPKSRKIPSTAPETDK